MSRKCPQEEALTDYFEGRLSDDRRSRIEKHISDCEICLETLAAGKGLLNGTSAYELKTVPAEVTESAVHLVKDQYSTPLSDLAEKVRRSMENINQRLSGLMNALRWRELAFSPVRGSEELIFDDLVQVRKSFRHIDAEIEIEKTTGNRAHIRIKYRRIGGAARNVRATLKTGEREVSSCLLNDVDYTLFDDLPFDQYSLVFSEDGATLGTYLFQIKDTNDEEENAGK